MEILKIATDKWYKCPFCWKYSIEPQECCGVDMVEVEEDYTEKVISD